MNPTPEFSPFDEVRCKSNAPAYAGLLGYVTSCTDGAVTVVLEHGNGKPDETVTTPHFHFEKTGVVRAPKAETPAQPPAPTEPEVETKPDAPAPEVKAKRTSKTPAAP